jgi:hypothetical protein
MALHVIVSNIKFQLKIDNVFKRVKLRVSASKVIVVGGNEKHHSEALPAGLFSCKEGA